MMPIIVEVAFPPSLLNLLLHTSENHLKCCCALYYNVRAAKGRKVKMTIN